MKYLNIKFLRDIKKMWTQFLSVLIMALLSVTIYSGMNVVWHGMGNAYDSYKDKTNLADGFVYAKSIDKNALEKLKDINYVDNAQGSMTFKVQSKIKNDETEITIDTFNNNSFDVIKPVLMSGIKLDENKDGIWIDDDYAKKHKLKKGDTLEISINNKKINTEISGTVLHSENIFFVTSSTDSFPDHNMNGYGYISEKYAEKLFGGISYNQARLRFSNNADVSAEKLTRDTKEAIGYNYYSATKWHDRYTIKAAEDKVTQMITMATLFSSIFILLSILCMYTCISRLVNNQISQIGTMKALGYSNIMIYIHYGMYGLLFSLAGCILGVVTGTNTVSKIILNLQKLQYSIPDWKNSVGYESIVLIALIIIISTVASLLTARKIIKCSPAVTIKGQIDSVKVSKRTPKRSKLSYGMLWNLRGIKAHPIRYIMSVIAVIGSIVLMTAGIGIMDSIHTSTDDYYNNQNKYKYVAEINKSGYLNLKDDVKDYNVQFSQLSSCSIKFNGDEKDGCITVLGNGNNIRLYNNENGNKINIDNEEAVITKKIASQLGVKKNDEISYRKDNSSQTEKVKISKIIDAKSPQGIFISADKVSDYTPDTLYIGDENAYKHVKDNSNINKITSLDKQKKNSDKITESVNTIAYMLVLASLLLSAVILYNLGIISYIEKYREYATMKVLGFYRKEITGIVLKESILNIVSGVILGVPLSLLFLRAYINIVSVDNFEWIPFIKSWHYALILIAVIIFSLLINLFVCRKIKKVDMVEALKSIE